jgi:hypothetical protein
MEQVDIFLFFYRPKVDTKKVKGIEYVQRLLYGYCTWENGSKEKQERW